MCFNQNQKQGTQLQAALDRDRCGCNGKDQCVLPLQVEQKTCCKAKKTRKLFNEPRNADGVIFKAAPL